MAPMPMRIVHHIHTYHTYAHTYSRPRAHIHISAYVAIGLPTPSFFAISIRVQYIISSHEGRGVT